MCAVSSFKFRILYDEFVVLDNAGRLQLPREYMDKLRLKGRVRVLLAEDHITIWPEESNQGEDEK